MPTIKTSLMAALTVGVLTACGGSPVTESTGEQIDDAAITAKVKYTFMQDKTVDASDINVETFKGAVQLSGFADSAAESRRAALLTSQVPGVKSVRNDIRVKKSEDGLLSGD